MSVQTTPVRTAGGCASRRTRGVRRGAAVVCSPVVRRHCTRSVAAPVGTPAGGGAYQLLLAQRPQEAALIHRAAGAGHRLLDRLLRGDHCCKVAYPKSLDSLSLGEPDPTAHHDLLAQALSSKRQLLPECRGVGKRVSG